MKKLLKIFAIIIGSFMGLCVILAVIDSIAGKKTIAEEPPRDLQPIKTTYNVNDDYAGMTQMQIDSIEEIRRTPERIRELTNTVESLKIYDYSKEYATVADIENDALFFNRAYGKAFSAGMNKDSTVKRLSDQIWSSLPAMQAKAFPKLRKAYGKIAAQKLWENDIYVTTSGPQNQFLNVQGGTFATNKNIKEFHQQLSLIFHRLRFQEVRYAWYKGQDDPEILRVSINKDKDLLAQY